MANPGAVPSAYLSFLSAAPLRRREMILIRVDRKLTGAIEIRRAQENMSRGARGDAGKEQTGNRTTFALLARWKLNKKFTQRRGGAAVQTGIPNPIFHSPIPAHCKGLILMLRNQTRSP